MSSGEVLVYLGTWVPVEYQGDRDSRCAACEKRSIFAALASSPNYWVVAIEGIALPMVHSAWITAIMFTVINAVLLLGLRIPAENKALKGLR